MFSRARRLSSLSTTNQRRLGDVGVHDHLVLGPRVVLPADDRLEVHRRELPLPHRVLEPRLEPALLLGVADREPVLAQQDAVLDEQPLEDRALVQEAVVLLRRAEPHHLLDARRGCTRSGRTARSPRPPAGARRSAGSTTGCAPLGRRGQGDDAGEARVEVLRDPLDRAALAGRVAALEDDHQPRALGAHPLLDLDELGLKPVAARPRRPSSGTVDLAQASPIPVPGSAEVTSSMP